MSIRFKEEVFNERDKEIIRCLSVLDQCSMNVSKASLILKISRPTLKKYQTRYWDKYLQTKSLVTNDKLDITKKTIEEAVTLAVADQKLSGLLDQIINRMQVILADEKLVKKVPFAALSKAAGVLLPYLMAKKGSDEDDDPKAHAHSSVLTKIQEAMKKAKETGALNIQNNITNIQNNFNNGTVEDQLQGDSEGRIGPRHC